MKTPKYPKAAKIEKWSIQFNDEQWENLCKHREFLDVVLTDLKKAQEIADKILEEED